MASRRAGLCAGALFAVACGDHSSGGGFPAVGADAAADVRIEASTAADANGPDAGSPDAATVLPECGNAMTCALPWSCDEADLLCEPVCSDTQPCDASTFCRFPSVGAATGNCIGPDYQCLGDLPTPPAPTASYFTIVDTYLDVSSGVAVPAAGLTVKVCAKTDALCATPENMGTTGANGTVTFTLPAETNGFDGYFDVTGPSGDGGTILETLVFSSQPVLAGGYGPTTNVGAAAAFSQITAPLGTLDPTRALVVVVDEACRSTPAFGASLTVSGADGATKIGYAGASGIVGGASTFPVNAQAVAYATNVPGATTTLTTVYAGQTVNSLDVVLRPDVLVTAYLTASPVPSP